MEQKTERAIDKGFEIISSGPYIFSVGFGIVLILLGAFLLLKNRCSQKKKGIANIGLLCLVLSFIAITSGLLQM